MTYEAAIWQVRLELLEVGCTWADVCSIAADDAEKLLSARAGKRKAQTEIEEAAWADAQKNAKTGVKSPASAWNDPSFWDLGDTRQWGSAPDGPPTQQVWLARDEQGTPLGPIEPWMLEYGLPPE